MSLNRRSPACEASALPIRPPHLINVACIVRTAHILIRLNGVAVSCSHWAEPPLQIVELTSMQVSPFKVHWIHCLSVSSGSHSKMPIIHIPSPSTIGLPLGNAVGSKVNSMVAVLKNLFNGEAILNCYRLPFWPVTLSVFLRWQKKVCNW